MWASRVNRYLALALAAIVMALSTTPASSASVAAAGSEAPAPIPTNAKLTFRGLGPIHVGMRRDEVEAVVGHRITVRGGVSSGCATSKFAPGVSGLFTDGRLARVSLTRYGQRGQHSADYRTRTGLGLGMPQNEIRAIYGSAAQRSPHAYVDGYYFKITHGDRRIVFATDQGVITDIIGGNRPEVDYIEGCA